MALNPQHGFDLTSPVVPPKFQTHPLCGGCCAAARDGVALNVDEAEIAMTARGEDLADLCASAARVRDAGLESAGRRGGTRPLPVSYYTQGFHPVALPGQVPRLHVRHVPGTLRAEGRGMFMEPDEIVDVARQRAGL